jgi:hypothetical protein
LQAFSEGERRDSNPRPPGPTTRCPHQECGSTTWKTNEGWATPTPNGRPPGQIRCTATPPSSTSGRPTRTAGWLQMPNASASPRGIPGKPGTTAPTCELTRMVMEGLEAAGEIDLVSLDPVEPVHEQMSLRRPPGSKQLLAGHTEGTDETGEHVFVGKDPGQTATGAPPGTVTPARRASACWVRSPPRAARPGAGRTPRTGPPRPRHCPAWTLRRRWHFAPNILRTSRRTRGSR